MAFRERTVGDFKVPVGDIPNELLAVATQSGTVAASTLVPIAVAAQNISGQVAAQVAAQVTPAATEAGRVAAIATVGQVPTVAAAAAAAAGPAVTAKVAGLDLIQSTDARVLTSVDGDTSFGVLGRYGDHTAATVRASDGGPTDAAEQILRDRLGVVVVDGAGGGAGGAGGETTAVSVDPATGLLTRDAADMMRESVPGRASRVTGLARTMVRVPVATAGSRPFVSSRSRLLIAGDSHAAATDVAATDRWHYLLSQARPDLTLTHASRGGSTCHWVALMAGGIEPAFTLDGGSLPASGSVDATLTDALRYRTEVSLGVTPGVAITSAGEIPVTLQRAASAAKFVVTRTTPGAAIPGPIRFRAATWDQNAGDTLLVIMGQNDQITTPSDVGPVVEGYSALIESRLALHPQALFMGLVLGGNTIPYSQVWSYNIEIDKELQRCWPEHYWSLMRWLIEDALDVVAVAPTAADVMARASYRTPPSLLLADQIHMNAATQAAFAPRLLAELTARNLIDPA